MNKKVWTAMLVLTVVFLGFLYVAKIFFPQEFVMCIENERLIQIGSFIDNHKWAYYLTNVCIGILGDYLFFGAVTRKLKLNYKLLLIIVFYNLIYLAVYSFANPQILIDYQELFVITSTCYMIFIPCLFTKEILPLSITYCASAISQQLSLSIRDFATLLTNVNSITMICFSAEAYLWLVLCFIIFNYKKGDEQNGCY